MSLLAMFEGDAALLVPGVIDADTRSLHMMISHYPLR